MGTCKYCGEKAGLLSSKHKECEEKHSRGLTDFEALLRRYFNGGVTASDLSARAQTLRRDNYLSDADFSTVADRVISNYTAGLRRPYSPQSMHLVDDALHALGLPVTVEAQEFAKKLMRGFMVDYFTDQLPLQQAQSRCQSVLRRFPMPQSQIDDAYWHVLDRAATKFLDDGILSDDEHHKIDEYTRTLGLHLNNVPAQYQGGDISKIGQAAIITAIQRGVVPQTNIQAPIILGKKESVLWVYNDMTLYQEKITREWVGRNRGMSFRVCKGVYYRTGGSKGHPVERSTMQNEGYGSLYVTNKNLIFWSQMKSVKIPFTKIVGFTPYSDGLEVHRDAASAKRLTLQGFDPWLIMNITSHLTNL